MFVKKVTQIFSLVKKLLKLSIFLLIILLWSCKVQKQWEGQEPVKKVNTESVPIQLQHKGVFNLGDGVFISNSLEGARLNGVVRNNDTLVTVLITPENSPINMSPLVCL